MRTKNRGNGQGSVYQLPNKTWIAVITLGYANEDGRMRRVTRSKSGFRTKKDALDYIPNLYSPAAQRKAQTFREVYDAWQPTHRAGKSTLTCYAAAMKHFAPVWYLRFDQIDVDDLQECLDACPAGKRTRENMKALAGLLYKYAVPRHLASINLGQYLVVNAAAAALRTGLPLDALALIGAHAETSRIASYVYSQCYLGFRPSELLALDVRDYNRRERAFIGGSKTDAGTDRYVTVSPKIQPIIDRLTRNKITGAVFCGDDGKPLRLEKYRDEFYSLLDDLGIANPVGADKRHLYTPHSCRHTFATLMKRVNGSEKDKLALIGHTSGEMLRHYQDVDFNDLRKITDAL